MMPPAPVRFSGRTCWPRPSLIFAATMRPTTSTLPPGGKPMSSLSGFAGYSCAGAASDAAAMTAAKAMRREFFMRPSVLIHARAGGPHDLRPLVGLLARVLAQLLRRLRHRVDALAGELRAHVGRAAHARRLAREALDAVD